MDWLFQCFRHIQSTLSLQASSFYHGLAIPMLQAYSVHTKSAGSLSCFYLIEEKCDQFKICLEVVTMSEGLNEQLKEVSTSSILQAMFIV